MSDGLKIGHVAKRLLSVSPKSCLPEVLANPLSLFAGSIMFPKGWHHHCGRDLSLEDTIMRTTTIPLVLVSLFLTGQLSPSSAQPAQTAPAQVQTAPAQPAPAQRCARPTCTDAGWPLRADYGGMQTGRFRAQRRQDWCRDHGRLRPANYVWEHHNKCRAPSLAAN